MLEVECRGQVALLWLDNPPANTWTESLLLALRNVVEDLAQRRDMRALVVSGRGDRFFSAGADLAQFAAGDAARADHLAACFAESFGALAAYPGLSVAAINGYAMGGGLEWALACDLLVAEEQAQLGLPETSVGLLPCGGGTQRLHGRVGDGWARRMVLCGERLRAEQALSIGLVDEVVPRGDAVARALQLAGQVVRQSPDAVAAAKRLLQQAAGGSAAEVYGRERAPFVSLIGGENQIEGVAAFMQKREPRWK